jgi:O-acetyl-ADP-ribose deacetylase (regulator of RNase III)
MEFVLTAVKDDLASAFEEHCGDLKNVSVFKGSIFDVDCDAVVSPANSFGFMDGGIDSWYRWRFGDGIQDSVRMAILRYWHGELPVGTAEIVETHDDEVPFLVAAPTMRVPMILGEDSINPYLAMRAVIMLIRREKFREGKFQGEDINSHVKKIASPGLGTGVGKVPAAMAAHQIREAILQHSEGKHSLPKSWFFASEAHQHLLKQDFKDLQK